MRHPERRGRIHLSSAEAFEHVARVTPLQLVDGDRSSSHHEVIRTSRWAVRADSAAQHIELKLFARLHHDRALEDVSKLAHVAWERIRLKPAQRLHAQLRHWTA